MSGAVCGQVIMQWQQPKVSQRARHYQRTHFLQPAMTHDMRAEANVLRFGNASAFAEARVVFAATGELVAHATIEFAF